MFRGTRVVIGETPPRLRMFAGPNGSGKTSLVRSLAREFSPNEFISSDRIMRRDDVLKRLQEIELELRERFGVRSLALFGSVARDEAGEGSDVDLLVEFDRPIGYFHLFHTQDFLEQRLGGSKVDLAFRDSVIDELREDIYGGAIDVVR